MSWGTRRVSFAAVSIMLCQLLRQLVFAHRLDNPLLGSLWAKQFQRPLCASLPARRDDLLLLSQAKVNRDAAQVALNSGNAESLTHHAMDRPLYAADVLDNLLAGETFLGIE